MDRKRNILVREMMLLMDRAKEIQSSISDTYKRAYDALEKAYITLGNCRDFAQSVPVDDSLTVDRRSVMGVELPTVKTQETQDGIFYGLHSTNSLLDEAYFEFKRVKKLTTELAEVESSVYRLADAISKTQKRANALKNIMIPRFEGTVKFITDALDEKEREDFSRLKVTKKQKDDTKK